jgi:hypothetical protein
MKRTFTKTSLLVLLLICLLSLDFYSQTPQYYNSSVSPISNSLPFGSLAASGYMCQWLIAAGEYSLPSPAPAGDITNLYINMSTSGTGTYTNLTILMGQASITMLPPGSYSGPLDTVYFRASVTLSSVINTWMQITLDSAFNYNPALGLVIVVSHCGVSGNGMSVWQNTGTAGIFRRNPMAGTSSCVFTYSSQDTRVLQNGLDIVPPVGIGNNNNEVPKNYTLEQNYPNPFNPVTSIRFGIPVSGHVLLKVYNSLGMEVAEIINGFMSAGNHAAEFDASGLASGVYYYTMRANDFMETKKMLLVK